MGDGGEGEEVQRAYLGGTRRLTSAGELSLLIVWLIKEILQSNTVIM